MQPNGKVSSHIFDSLFLRLRHRNAEGLTNINNIFIRQSVEIVQSFDAGPKTFCQGGERITFLDGVNARGLTCGACFWTSCRAWEGDWDAAQIQFVETEAVPTASTAAAVALKELDVIPGKHI